MSEENAEPSPDDAPHSPNVPPAPAAASGQKKAGPRRSSRKKTKQAGSTPGATEAKPKGRWAMSRIFGAAK